MERSVNSLTKQGIAVHFYPAAPDDEGKIKYVVMVNGNDLNAWGQGIATNPKEALFRAVENMAEKMGHHDFLG